MGKLLDRAVAYPFPLLPWQTVQWPTDPAERAAFAVEHRRWRADPEAYLRAFMAHHFPPFTADRDPGDEHRDPR